MGFVTEVARLEGVIALVGADKAKSGLVGVGAAADKTQAQLDGVGKSSTETGKGLSTMSTKLDAAGQRMQATGGMLTRRMTLPLLGLGIAAAKVGSDFNTQMSKVEAKSGATAQQMERMRAQALQLGADTSFSAKEAAEGMEVLAAAGMKSSEVMAAMPGLLDAAAASGEGIAATSNVVANALAQFNMQASDSTRIADVLAKASNETQGSIGSMGEALKYAGTGARSLGFDLEETTGLISMMVKAGIDGGQAGTALRMGLMKLAAVPPMRALDKVGDISPKLESIWKSAAPVPDKLKQMSVEFAKLDGTTRTAAAGLIFGTEASTGMLTVLEGGPSKIDAWTASMRDSAGAAAEMGQTMRDNFGGDIEALGGSIETAFIGLFDAASGPLRSLVQGLTGLVNAFSDASPRVQQLVVIFGTLAAAAGPLLMMAGGIAAGLSAVAAIAGVVSAPVLGIAAAAIAAGAGFAILYTKSETVRTAVSGLWTIMKATPLATMIRAIDSAAQSMGGWGNVFRHAGIIALEFGILVLEMSRGVVRAVSSMSDGWLQKFSTMLNALAFIKPELKGAARAVSDMAAESAQGTSKMERAMTRDIARANDQIRKLKNELAGIPTSKTVNITVQERRTAGRGPTAVFAKGGEVRGPGSGTSDSIPAMLSDGEHVLTAREVQAMGGHERVEKMRHHALQGQVRFFAKGGAVKKKVTPRQAAQNRATSIANSGALQGARIDAGLAAAEQTARTTDDIARHQQKITAGLALERKWASFIGSASYRRLDAQGKAGAQQSLAAARRDVQSSRDAIKAINEAARASKQDGVDAAKDAQAQSDEEARAAENLRREALGLESLEEEAKRLALNAIRRANGLAELGPGGAGSGAGAEADLGAQLAQMKRRAEVAEANFQIGQGELRALGSSGDIGFGRGRNAYQSAAPTIIVNSLTGYDPAIQQTVADAAGGGFAAGGNSYRMYTGRG